MIRTCPKGHQQTSKQPLPLWLVEPGRRGRRMIGSAHDHYRDGSIRPWPGGNPKVLPAQRTQEWIACR